MSRLVRLLILFAVWTAAFGAGAVKGQALINFGGGWSPTPTRVPAVTLTPTVTPRPQVTGTPTATPGSKFGSPTPTGKVSLTPTKIPGVGSICGKSCSKGRDCA